MNFKTINRRIFFWMGLRECQHEDCDTMVSVYENNNVALCRHHLEALENIRPAGERRYTRIYCVRDRDTGRLYWGDVRIASKGYKRKHQDPNNCVTLGWIVRNIETNDIWLEAP